MVVEVNSTKVDVAWWSASGFNATISATAPTLAMAVYDAHVVDWKPEADVVQDEMQLINDEHKRQRGQRNVVIGGE
jgi:hypothetical protein